MKRREFITLLVGTAGSLVAGHVTVPRDLLTANAVPSLCRGEKAFDLVSRVRRSVNAGEHRGALSRYDCLARTSCAAARMASDEASPGNASPAPKSCIAAAK
jgi:hypothetical protein